MVGTDTRVGNSLQVEIELFCQETRQLKSLIGKALGTACPLGVVSEECGVFVDQRIGTGSGRGNYIIIFGKCPDHILSNFCCAGAITAVQCRLATAALFPRHPDSTSRPFKQGHRGKRHLRTHEVRKTGDEQPDIDR